MTIHAMPLPPVQGGGPVVVDDWGFNLRATLVYGSIVDGANEVWFGDGVEFLYPSSYVKANLDPDLDAGWGPISDGSMRNRNSAIDRRLAGIAFSTSANPHIQVTVPNGDVRISLAMGDAIVSVSPNVLDLWDGLPAGGILLEHYEANTAGGEWIGADHVVYDEQGWVAANDGLTARIVRPITNGSVTIAWQATGVNDSLAHYRVEVLA